MTHSSWAWAYENYQVPKKGHEHHNNDSNDRTLQKYGTQKVELSEMGFSLRKWVSLHLHLRTIFVSMPSKDLTFPLCSLSLSLSYFISQFIVVNFLGHCDFLGFCSCRSFGVCLISNFNAFVLYLNFSELGS